MRHHFYQRVVPINVLVYMGDWDMSENIIEWTQPIYQPVEILHGSQGMTYDEAPTHQSVTYRRRRSELGDIFVADVKCEVQFS